MTKTLLAGLMAAALAGAPFLTEARGANDPKRYKFPQGEFTGQVIVVETRGGSVTLEKPRVRNLGNRICIVGRVLEADGALEPKMATGATAWMPVTEVVQILEFKDRVHLRKFLREARPGSGSRVEVEWQGTWWAAVVLETANRKFKIHYIGYDNSSDEWVPPQRIRRLTGSKEVRGGH